MQGQTTYGGLSAALCLEGARRLMSDDAHPLRSATVCFVGAAGGPVDIEASVLRRGKATSFVNSALMSKTKAGDMACATSCTFLFGAARPKSSIDARLLPPLPSLPGPSECEPIFHGFPPLGEALYPPLFTQHFEALLAAGAPPAAGAADADLRIWVRHKGGDDSGGVPNVAAEVALLALADMAPPAACSLFAAEVVAAAHKSRARAGGVLLSGYGGVGARGACGGRAAVCRYLRVTSARTLQGYLAHEKLPPPPRTTTGP
ncbi:thioesterase-like superfamily-domain-containing protein [Baffinella frigidus]|nr:thioesterase-like superfamily-domain-containing protein [Cryptophyta sp. CCMP2293]